MINDNELDSLIKSGYISGISLATVQNNIITHLEKGIRDTNKADSLVNQNTVFEAASLSKPLFAYLIIQLINDKKLNESFLDDPIPNIPYNRFNSNDEDKVKNITPRMVLSHQTGLPNWQPNQKLEFQFEPGTAFKYSGEGYHYLQKVVENILKSDLESLAKKYVFEPLSMQHTHYERSAFPATTQFTERHDEIMQVKPRIEEVSAAGSLQTTATDYAKFLIAVIHDQKMLEEITKKPISLTKDQDASQVDKNILSATDWGMGWGLQKNSDNNYILFHWGDMGKAKAFAAINSEDKSAVVYLANSENGLSIAQDVLKKTIGNLDEGLSYLIQKYNYEQHDTPGWKERHEGLIAESKGNYESAAKFYEAFLLLNKNDVVTKNRLNLINVLQTVADHPVQPDIRALENRQGQYGPLQIKLENNQLYVLVAGQKNNLLPLSKNEFLDTNDKVKIEFVDKNKIKCHFLNGSFAEFEKPVSLKSYSIFAHKEETNSPKAPANEPKKPGHN